MRLSTSTNIYCIRPDGPPAELARSIELCAAAGYEVVDVSFQDAVRFGMPFASDQWQAWVDHLQAVAASHGVTLGQAHLPFYNHCDPTFADSEALDELARRAIVAAGQLGIPWVVAHAGTVYGSITARADSLRQNVEYYTPLLDLAASVGVGIAIENLWELPVAPLRRYTSEPEEVMELVQALGAEPDLLGVCWDFAHASYQQQDQSAGLALVAERLRAVHVCDHYGIEADHQLPYTGVIDWTTAMRALQRTGFAGDLTFEMHKYTANLPDPLIASALEHSRRVGDHLISLAASAQTDDARAGSALNAERVHS